MQTFSLFRSCKHRCAQGLFASLLLAPFCASAAWWGQAQAAHAPAAAHAGDGALEQPSNEAPAQLAAGIRITRDVAYGGDARQRLDVYAPVQAQGAPVLVMVHGGAWMFGDKAAKSVVENKANHWVPKGLIFVSINYRMLPDAPVSLQVQDVAAALAYVQKHAADWGGDGARVVLMGHSAGAHLVALLSASPAIAAAQGVQPWLGTVALDSAAYDVPALMQSPHPRFYDRVFGSDPAVWRQDSPTLQMGAKTVPFLAICSSQRKNSCPAARGFVMEAQSMGAQAQLQPEDKSHLEINRDLGMDPDYTQTVDAFMRGLGVKLAQ